ncbi:MAG: hypothetical protein FJ026_01795 [Chloroflexi bacterium]|nr:hypothetical protein [Chloroflexota bacterium]
MTRSRMSNLRRVLRMLMPVVMAVGMGACQTWRGCKGFTAEDALWLIDDRSPNYRHLGWLGSSEPFVFAASDLEHLCRLNHFDVSEGQDEVLFGLRGCRISGGDAGGFVSAVELTETAPDHVSYQCVLGVWRRSSGEIALFQGSTVPNWHYTCQQVEQGGRKANMLPTGRYVYAVGRHREMEGAFRLEAQVVVLRSNDDLVYETTDQWDASVPLDNIHPGGCPNEPYSSAGCQTVPGSFGVKCPEFPNVQAGQHAGPWASFRELAGLDQEDNRDKWGAPMVYVLLTCRDARAIRSFADPTSLIRLRFGSSGDAVRALQMALQQIGYPSVPVDGQMGTETTMAYIDWQQKQYGGAADGIVTPEEAIKLGFSLSER